MKKEPSIVVGPVSSIDSVARLLLSGATDISFLVEGGHHLYTSGQELEAEAIKSIIDISRNSRGGRSRFGLIASEECGEEELAQMAEVTSADFVEVDYRFCPWISIERLRRLTRCEIRVAGMALGDVDDPEWPILWVNDNVPFADSFVLSLLPEYEDPFEFLAKDAGRFAEDVTLEDVAKFAEMPGWILEADWSSDKHLESFLEQMPATVKYSVYLGKTHFPTLHPHLLDLSDAVEFIEKVVSVRRS